MSVAGLAPSVLMPETSISESVAGWPLLSASLMLGAASTVTGVSPLLVISTQRGMRSPGTRPVRVPNRLPALGSCVSPKAAVLRLDELDLVSLNDENTPKDMNAATEATTASEARSFLGVDTPCSPSSPRAG